MPRPLAHLDGLGVTITDPKVLTNGKPGVILGWDAKADRGKGKWEIEFDNGWGGWYHRHQFTLDRSRT